ncbi:MAG: alanine--tRNA ligase [Bacteroidota bacterium]
MPERPTTAADTRQAFLDFFREKGHEIIPGGFPLVPQDDPTLLFINAGMNPFKDVFLGTGSRPYTRVADTQKCLRVSGKHNDLDEVGVDTYHHTFFEMLGNWSFGDYFKREAITWAWELLVDRWGMDPSRLYVTVHEGDEALGLDPDKEAATIWETETSIPATHILYASSKDNFWMMGDTGPCGPCSEIHVDLRPDAERAHVPGQELVNQDDPRVIEIWNLVFIQYNAALTEGGGTSLEPLPAKHVDTGMGFERLCAVLQGHHSTYDTDLFAPILQRAADLSPDDSIRGYDDLDGEADEVERKRIALRVVSDHVRTLVFAITDGAQPGNTGRGYVIRRILRRAVRYGYQGLSIREPFLFKLAETVVETMGEAFPDIRQSAEFVRRVIKAEEEAFLRTLGMGLEFTETFFAYTTAVREQRWDSRVIDNKNPIVKPLNLALGRPNVDLAGPRADVEHAAETATLRGEIVFLLHDTYGFPSDLTAVMAREHGLEVDEARFEELMEEQRDRARAAGTFKTDNSQVDTWDAVHDTPEAVAFVGYDRLEVTDAKVLRTRTVGEGEDARHEIVLSQTPFYAESGGQVGDTGTLRLGEVTVRVLDTQKSADGAIVHVVDRLPEDATADVTATVDGTRRQRIMRHHTATHLLHRALREALGDHVQQKGSLVAPDRLRFDFAHYEKVGAQALREIEARVNEAVLMNLPLGEERGVPIDEAKARGAMALFGEKYGDAVRVITFTNDDDFVSVELCGGTHVQSTAEVGLFRFTSEGSVASGVRRVEAVAGEAALAALAADSAELEGAREAFGQTPDGLAVAVTALQDEKKALEKEVAALRQQAAAAGLSQYLAEAEEVEGVRVVAAEVPGADSDALRGLAEEARERLGEKGVAVFGSSDAEAGKVLLVAAVTDDLLKQVPAGKLVGALAKKVGGGGGGRPHLATAGGRQPENLGAALAAAADEVRAALS